MDLTNYAASENLDKIIKGPQENCSFIPELGGMGQIFYSKMVKYGDAIAQVDALTGEQDTYNSLLKRCIRTAIAMRSKGLTNQDLITICTFNHLNSCVPFISSLFLGVKTANLDPTLTLSDTVYLLKQVCPKMIFTSQESVKLIEEAIKEAKTVSQIVVFGSSTEYCEFEEFLKPSPDEMNFEPVEVEDIKDTVAVFFSSGTTGLPKGICINHYGLLTQGYLLRNMGYNIDVFLAFASMYWISCAIVITSCILSRGCRIIIPKFHPKHVWELITQFKVTMMFLAPSQAVAMNKIGRPEEIDTSHLSELIIGGGAVSKQQMEEIREILPGTNVVLNYGQTEVSGMALAFQPKKSKDMVLSYKNPGSSGRPIPGIRYKVVETETEKLLGPNQHGELRLKTEFQMNGYYNLEASVAWDSEGWLKTGDVVYYDEDQCFYVVDRIKDMLKFQSWHVPPALLEGILLTHSAVEAAVVVGLPDPEDGDHPIGVVVLKKSYAGKISEREIEEYVANKVDDRMRLRGGVRIIDVIPLTPTGKIKRRDIRDMIIKGEI